MSKLKLMLLLPLAALCLPVGAAQDAQGAPSAQGQGMVVVRDAQTGQLRMPTAAEVRAMQPPPSAALTRQAPPAIVTGPGGRRSVRLGESHMVYSVVTRDSEGKLGDQCVQGVHAAEHAATQPAPATKHEEHRHESR